MNYTTEMLQKIQKVKSAPRAVDQIAGKHFGNLESL